MKDTSGRNKSVLGHMVILKQYLRALTNLFVYFSGRVKYFLLTGQ